MTAPVEPLLVDALGKPFPDNVLLLALSGSHAYGAATAESDVDRHGVYAHPTSELIGLGAPQIDKLTWTTDKPDPDVTLHDVGKFVKLALRSNPTILETLYVAPPLIEMTSPFGEELLAMRDRFLSGPSVKQAYFGYAEQQLLRLQRTGKYGNGMDKRREKNSRHLMRILEQGMNLYQTGILNIEIADLDRYFAIGKTLAADPGKAAVIVREYGVLWNEMPTPLPDEPDFAWAKDFVLRVRRHYLDTHAL